MLLEGTVTNVAAFGAFVDIGVHQDGLVHVSQLADRFVKDPHEVVKAGDVVKVRVVEVDVKRKRIGLTMRKDGAPTQPASARAPADIKGKIQRWPPSKQLHNAPPNGRRRRARWRPLWPRRCGASRRGAGNEQASPVAAQPGRRRL